MTKETAQSFLRAFPIEEMPAELLSQWDAAQTDLERAECLLELALVFNAKNFCVSQRLCEKALDLALQLNHAEFAAKALINLAWTSTNLNQPVRAVEYCDQALHLLQEHGLGELEAHALNVRALTSTWMGDNISARRDLQRAVFSAKAHSDQYNLLRTYVNAAWISNLTGRPQNAVHYLNLLEEGMRELSDPANVLTYRLFLYENRAHTMAGLAQEAAQLGRQQALQEALASGFENVLRCQEMLAIKQDTNIAMMLENHLSTLHYFSGNLDAAEKHALQALNLLQHSDVGVYHLTYLCLAEVYVARQEWALALEHYTLALTLIQGQGRHHEAQNILLKIADVHTQNGNLQGALQATQAALTEVQTALHSFTEIEKQQARLEAEYSAQKDDLSTWQERLRRAELLARQDPLTGLLNRRGLAEGLQQSQDTAHNAKTLVAFFDLDHFKSVNDRFSHEVGDKTLQLAAQILQSMLPQSGLLARYGGEEFVLVAPYSAALMQQLEACRAAFEHHDWTPLLDEYSLTVSVGFASGAAQNVQLLLRHADENLYRAKSEGRNRIYPPLGGE